MNALFEHKLLSFYYLSTVTTRREKGLLEETNMMHQQSMMVGDMLPVHSEIPMQGEEMNNVGYENSGSYAYDDLFPALPHSAPAVQRSIQPVTNKLRVGSSLHTQVQSNKSEVRVSSSHLGPYFSASPFLSLRNVS